MTYEYETLDNDKQYAIIKGRLNNYEEQLLNSTQNLAGAQAISKQVEIDRWSSQIDELQKRCAVEKEALSKLNKPEVEFEVGRSPTRMNSRLS